jgi:glycosyltransferase involved in cell wall biosynthesis
MKVMLVDGVAELGGAQRSLLELAQALHARGVDLLAAVPHGPLAVALGAAGVPVRPLPVLRLHACLSWRTVPELVCMWRAQRVLARLVVAERPDLVHANGTLAAVAVAVGGGAGRVPVVWHVRDLVLRRWLVRWICRRVAGVLAISEAVATAVTELVPSPQRSKIRLLRNGVDTAHFRPGDRAKARQEFQLPPDLPLVGMLAHLVPWKRHAFFLEVAAAVRRARPEVQFVLAGRDLCGNHPHLRATLEAQVAAAGLTGALHWLALRDDIAALLPALDVLVHPAANEPFGRVVCEAMAAGIPVVAARRAGPATLVPEGVGGYLVAPDDAEAFGRQVLHLLADPAAARAMGAQARAHVVAHFDVARVATELLAVYRELLGQGAGGRW